MEINDLNAVQAKQKEAIQLLTGGEVLELLRNKRFLTAWDELFQSCPWATIFQGKEYVTTWYSMYHKLFLPILVKAERGEKLVGLLALGKYCDGSGLIVGAGAKHAEYQTWLAEPSNGEEFVQSALYEIQKIFPKSDIHLKFLPDKTPLSWTKSNPIWRKTCVLRRFTQPLLLINEVSITKELRKKNRREKINRLNKLGKLKFERITDSLHFSSVINELITQNDFRKVAMYNIAYFEVDPLKKSFLLALFEQNLFHATVLKLNNQIIASNISIADRGWAHLWGLSSHAPSFGKYSPGILHFLLLGQQLAKEGYKVLDLTPGDDPYKYGLATEHAEAHELRISGSLPSYAKDMAIVLVWRYLGRLGINRKVLKYKLVKKVHRAKERFRVMLELGPVQLAKSLLYRPGSAGKQQATYQLWPATAPPPAQGGIRRDSLDDLLLYRPARAQVSRWEFLEEAMVRFETRQHSYTLAEEGRLLLCVWLGAPGAGPEEAAALQDLYCHPDGAGKLQAFLGAVAGEVAGTQKCRRVTISADTASKALSWLL
ncbi:GNAT family N-acetyltransferase [Pontibacter anaerobius]|uniref:GNAT family N-acetyltransferase n=1 Tax=Pontibacter anaerobius TaxID=2993940 RepID=A0ABT3RKI5_9BACT|nr:GNAT family N-acetyltransferase [Pontibacter anaerobius]MCX2742204.1 GNAT family N-acetyltransferase [Pontibacter anaerobius]